jgi:hypothetical protein
MLYNLFIVSDNVEKLHQLVVTNNCLIVNNIIIKSNDYTKAYIQRPIFVKRIKFELKYK